MIGEQEYNVFMKVDVSPLPSSCVVPIFSIRVWPLCMNADYRPLLGPHRAKSNRQDGSCGCDGQIEGDEE